VILKDLEGIGRGLIKVLFQHLTGGTGDDHETISVRIAGVSTEIRTKHLLNTSLDHYRYMNLLVAILFSNTSNIFLPQNTKPHNKCQNPSFTLLNLG
jgi:hypothetical protein